MLTEAKKKVLKFLVDTLNKNKIAFQVSGGLGAIAYGSKRELRDIDIEINKKNCPVVRELFKEFIAEDYQNYKNAEFDAWWMELDIDGVEVDINQVEESYAFDKEGNKHLLPEDLIDTELKTVESITFPVQNKTNLIAYKKIVGRDTDLFDIEAILTHA